MTFSDKRCRGVAAFCLAAGIGFFVVGCTDPAAPANNPRASRRITPGTSNADEWEHLPETDLRFVNVSEEIGSRFTYRNGEEAEWFAILESLGGGVALLDYDRDGHVDVCLTGGGRFGEDDHVVGLPPGFFRNEGHWRFGDVTGSSRVIDSRFYQHAAVASDFNHDGFPDMLITGYGGLALYRNEGDGTFSEIAEAAGAGDSSWSVGAAFGDVNGDNDPDLYVTHYVDWSPENDPVCHVGPGGQRDICPPREFQPLPDILYLSEGDGTFRDASRECELRPDGKGLGVLMADLDLDGDLDIYVTNDTVDNFLYLNDGDGTLREIAAESGTAFNDMGLPDGSMGVDVGDVNLDGRPDLFVANYERESFAVYRNEGGAMFQHVSSAIGVTAAGGQFVGWGSIFFDADRDGDEDVFVTNGHVVRFPHHAPVRQTPLLFENREGRRLDNVAAAAGDYTAAPHMGRGVASGDLDGDGDLDLVVSHINEPAAFLDNRSEGDGHGLSLELVGTRSPREPVGALVRVRTTTSEQFRIQRSGGSYASTSDRKLFFGLGTDDRVQAVSIVWPSGHKQELTDIEADRIVHVVEGDGAY